jgi:hypothetical protein
VTAASFVEAVIGQKKNKSKKAVIDQKKLIRSLWIANTPFC